METIILYLVKVNIAFAILYLLYKMFFNKDTFLHLKRYILLLICIVSVLYPFIEFDLTFDGRNETINTLVTLQNIFLPATEVSAVGAGRAINWFHVVGLTYATGIIFLTIRSVMEIGKVSKKISRSKKVIINGIDVCVSEEKTEPYSFLKWICISPELYRKDELNEILFHENAHVSQLHSFDILFIQVILIFNWFNPFLWLLRNEIKINHEYLADRKVIDSGHNKKKYQYHLIGFTRKHTLSPTLYNSFSILPLKNRLKMLNRKATPGIMVYKYLLFIPIFVFLLIFNNCDNSVEPLQKLPAELPAKVNSETVFEVVEKMPEFKGGQSALMHYLNNSIKYPVTAQAEGIQGRVIVQFIVDADGSINEPVVARSVDESLDKEALRVISKMPSWIPGQQRGKPVRVKYTVPIKFKLQ
jgi:TonB family C-terminal domain